MDDYEGEQSAYDSIYDQLRREGLSDLQISAVFGVLGLEEQFPLLEGDIEFAEERIAGETPGGRRVGGVYVAAHPLEHLASGASRVLGELQRHKGRSRQDMILKEIEDRRRAGVGMPDIRNARAYPYRARAGSPTTGWY